MCVINRVRYDFLLLMFRTFSLQHQLLEKSQSSLDVVIDNPQDAKDLSGMLLKISDTPNLIVQQYAFTRIEEVYVNYF